VPDPAAPVVVALIAATSAPAWPQFSATEAAPTAIGDGERSIRDTTRKPCCTSADFHVSDNATAALAEAMHWLRITAPAPYPQRSVAVPAPVTMSSQLMICSSRAAVHSELQMKGLSLSRSWGRELSDMPELKSTSRATDGARDCLASVNDCLASLRSPMHGTQSGANQNADVGDPSTHPTRIEAQPYACVAQAGFLHSRHVTLQSRGVPIR